MNIAKLKSLITDYVLKPIVTKLNSLTKRQKAYAGAFGVLVAILLWAFISAGIITHNFNRSQLQTDQNRQEAAIRGIILTETKDEKKYWEIYGENGNYDSKNGIAMLDNVIGNFFDENNQVSMSFESSKGTYNEKKGQIILYEDTYIVLKDFTTLRANRLIWSGKNIPTVATGNVTITRNNDFIATADKVEISPDYDKFKITGNTVSKAFNNKEKK